MSDNIIVYGIDKLGHDRNLKAILDRLQSHNAKLDTDKCNFAQSQVRFYGHIFSKDGLASDPKKPDTLINVTPPTNQKEVKSLLGLASYICMS